MRTIRQFEIVEALATHRHFGRAAAALGVSQPSLTRSLNRIEELTGSVLFDRAGVKPTIFGEIVLRYGRGMLSNWAELSRELALIEGLDLGELSVAMAFYPADISGYAAAALLSQRHPNVALELRVLDWPRAKEAVLAGAADLAFADIRAASQSSDFDVYPVRAGPLSFFCASRHPLAQRNDVGFDDLTGYPWVGPSLTPAMSAAMPREPRPCCVIDPTSGHLRPRILVESFGAAKQIVRSGEALSAGLPLQIEAEVAGGHLAVIPVSTFIDINYGFILKRDRMVSPTAKAFMKTVREVEGRISG